MKSFFRLFLYLCFLLLSGYSNIYAYPNEEVIANSPLKTLEKSEDARFSFAQNIQASTIRYSIPERGDDSYRLKATEVEEEDETEKYSFSKKNVSIRSYLATFFYAQITEKLCSCIKIRLFSTEYFPFASSSRLLAFGVFRI